MIRTLTGHRTGFGARQGFAFGLSLLCGISLCLVTAGPALAAEPGAPTIGTAAAGDGQATVTWTAPVDNGGFAITGYTVTATPGPQTATTNGSTSATVVGLTNGTSYTFTVTAHNVDGDSIASDASNAVTPATVPGVPTIGTATAGEGQATVTWSAPSANGGSPITGYTVTATPGPQTATTNGSMSATVTGLTNGTSYTFTVHATNSVGSSGESASSNAVTPMPPPTVPGAPTGVSASPGNASVVVSWSSPADNGGSTIVSYTVATTATGSGAVPAPVSVASSATVAAVNGLTNGEFYRFTVRTTNAIGSGPASVPSDAVAPGTVPGMPIRVSASSGDGSVTVSWSAPLGQGGSPVSSYTVITRLSGGGQVSTVTVASPATAATVGGLTNGLSYTFRVLATNAAGNGPLSALVGPVTPAADIPVVAAVVRSGYWMVESDGSVYRFGDAVLFGDPKGLLGTARAVDLEPTPSGNGYWVVDELGRVYGYGDAVYQGNVSGLVAGERVSSLSATPSGAGYWIFTTRGRVVPLGDATFHGDVSAVALNGPVRDSILTTSGKGYYMVASDGGIFAFGDAVFYGSMGGTRLNAPVQSLVPDADGVGYWLVAGDGGIFAFDAPFRGSMGGTPLNQPITGMVRFGDGYLMVGADGGIFSFSDRTFLGSLGGNPPAHPIVSVAVLDR